MRIVLIARGDPSDTAAIAWIAHLAGTADDVHLFFPYRELAVHGSSWSPAVHAAAALRDRVRRTAYESATLARRSLAATGCAVGSSVVAVDRNDLLADAGAFADIVVLGVPSAMPAGFAFHEARRACTHAVILVPEGYQQVGGTVVVADLAGFIDDSSLTIAAKLARPSAATVLVMRSYLGDLVDVDDAVKQTEILDEGLAAWQARAGESRYSALAAEIVEEPMHQALRRQRGHVSALVAPLYPGRAQEDLVAVALGELSIPVVWIPTRAVREPS
jgi:hypothetical protein